MSRLKIQRTKIYETAPLRKALHETAPHEI